MYHLYHTPAVVLGGTPVGEGSRMVELFTREFGLLAARAQGVRLARAKLRYHLTDFSYTDAWLVRGREVWRLANALSRANFYTLLSKNPPPTPSFRKGGGNGGGFSPNKQAVLARAARLLRRLLPPEGKHEKLFDAVVSMASFLCTHECTDAEIRDAEILLALRTLYHLGYLGEPREFLDVAAGTEFDAADIGAVLPLRRQLVSVINSSLRLTGL